jgi:DNA-binding HxlR family transcriptional regulator
MTSDLLDCKRCDSDSVAGSSGSGDRSAVDHVLSARDGTRSRRGHERDEICHLTRPSRASKRNAAERLHDDLFAALVVGARLVRQPLGQRDGRLRFDPEGRWKLVILFHLFGGRKLRFSDLERAIPAISQKMLIQQLRQLERDGIVARIVHAQVPPKVEYHLTMWGQSLCPALDKLLTWAEKQPSSPSGSQSAKATRPPRG